MKGTGQKFAAGLLATVLVMAPAVPVLAAVPVNAQSLTTSHAIQAFPRKVNLSHQSSGSQAQPATQVLQGTVSPMVKSGKATRISDTDPNRVLHLDFVLKPRDKAKMTSIAASGKKVSLAEYKAEFAPTSTSVQTVRNFLNQVNLKVVSSSDDMLTVEGTAMQIEKALHIKFNNYKTKDFSFYSTTNDPVLPTGVATVLQGIIGLSQTPYHAVPIKQSKQKQYDGQANGFFTPDEVRTAYGMIPAYGNGIDGTGRNIAILMTGDFSDSDVQSFSQTYGLPYDSTKITRKFVPGVSGAPPYHIDEESTLDVEWSHAFAPGANITEYEFGAFTEDDSDLFSGLDYIMSSDPTVDVINMSFGGEEGYMSANSLDTWHTKFAEAVAKGITPVASSGDTGAYGWYSGYVGVQSPASDPFVLAVGGTSLTIDVNNNRSEETAWGEAPFGQWVPTYTDGSGGGYSSVFADLAGDPSQKRGVPDVSALGKDLEMYVSQDDGWISASGTSFAAPMWSGIVALAAQKAQRGLGWINPAIHNIATDPNEAGVFKDITTGNNGAYNAQTGWDAVTGWGSPGNGWSLVQAIASQSASSIQTGAHIDGTVIGDVPYDFAQKIMNGTGTVDILGSGFGDAQGSGYVTLSQGGQSYQVPVKKWTDTDITMDVDADGTGLFSGTVTHPNAAGAYQLAVHVVDQNGETVSNSTTVKLADFLDVTDSSSTNQQPTPMSNGTDYTYQDVTITAMTPDGTQTDVNLADTTLQFSIYSQSVWDTSGFVVMQNGQPCQQITDDSFQVKLSGGKATLQVASHLPGTFEYDVSGPDLFGYDNSASFAAQYLPGTQLVNETLPGYNVASTGTDNVVSFALLDANNNMTTDADQIQVSLAPQNGSYPKGNISINDPNNPNDQPLTPPSGSNPTFKTNLVGDGYSPNTLNVSDTQAETVTLTITDLTHPSIAPLQVPLIFTAAHFVQIKSMSANVPVSVDGQNPNWQVLQITSLDANNRAVTYTGKADLELLGSQDYLSTELPNYTVQARYSTTDTWQPLEGDQWGYYQLDLSKGSLQVRVASPKAESIDFRAEMYFSNTIDTDETVGNFTPGAIKTFVGQSVLPHMATSSTQAPQYVPVEIGAVDANGNFVKTNDTVVLSEQSKSPLYTIAIPDKKGKLQVVRPVAGMWKINLSQLTDQKIYVASAKPGVAMFQLADLSRKGVTPGSIPLDFVNSMPVTLQAPAPAPAAAGTGIQTIEVDVADQNGQPVINSTDQVAMAIDHTGGVTVTDANGQPLPTDNSGRYLAQAVNGVVKYYVADLSLENVSYTFTDLSESVVTGTTGTGSFVLPSKFSLTPIGNTNLGADHPVNVTVTAMDSKGHALNHATVFLSLSAASGASAVVNSGTPQATSLTDTAVPFTTDDQGQLTITYTTPHVLPNGGTDTITAQETAEGAQAVATTRYTYPTAYRYQFSSTSIANPGSLHFGDSKTVTVQALDKTKHPLANTTLYLSLLPNGKSTATASVHTENGDVALNTEPQPLVTDANGKVTITYSAPKNVMPNGGTDTLVVQDNEDPQQVHVKANITYTFASTARFVWSGQGKPIAPTGSLTPGQSATVTLTAYDAKNKPMPNTVVYLSTNATLFGGTTYVTQQDPYLSNTPWPYITDGNGQITVTYTAPQQMPGNETDTITAATDGLNHSYVKGTISYSFKPVGKLMFTPTTLGSIGSLQAGTQVPLTLNVQDAYHKAMPNTIVFLSINSLAGSQAEVDPSNRRDPLLDGHLNSDPQAFLTDSEGNIHLVYTVASPLPNGGIDTITAQDAANNPKQKVRLSYTFLKQILVK